MVDASKNARNPGVYCEVDTVSVRFVYNCRSGYVASSTNLSAPNRAQYLRSKAEQRHLNSSGRQYCLEARYRF